MADERPYFEELVENVQQLQRTDPEGKLKWMSYAIQNGNGRYDPKFHTQEYMLDFFEQLEADTIEIDPSVRGAPGPLVRNEVFVGGLPQDVDESEINAYFSEWGQVAKVEYKEGRGFCFITLGSEEEVDTLLAHHDEHYIREAFVDVKRAEDRRKGGKSNDKGKGKSGGKGGKGVKGGKGKSGGKGEGKGGKGSSFGGYRPRDDSHSEPPAKKGKGGKSSGGFSKGGSKGGSKGSSQEAPSWQKQAPSKGDSKGKSSFGGKGASSKGASGGKGGGSGGYQKTHQSYSTPSKGGKGGAKGGAGKGGKGGKGGKRSSPY